MSIYILLRRYTSALLNKFSWAGLIAAVVAHAVIAYAGLTWFEESHLSDPMTFTYFYLTTALTVGYGDLAPQTPLGRIFVSAWIMLGGIALLTAVIGKTTNITIDLWRKGMKGKKSFADCAGHTVVVGWRAETSERVVDLLLQDETSNDHLIVICATGLDENPMPGKAEFVKGESLFSLSLLERAGVRRAERVLVHTDSDDQTLTAVLAVQTLGPSGHVVAHFNSSETAALARTYAPSLECTSNMATELLVRASQDPGLSSVINELLAVGEGATQYRMPVPAGFNTSFGVLYQQLKDAHNATLIGYRPPHQAQPMVNPPNNTPVAGGELFYIATSRLKEIAA